MLPDADYPVAMTDDELDNIARHMLTEMVVRHAQTGSDEWLNLLAKRCPDTTITDREYIAMRIREMVVQSQSR